jgi:hypothetical protein
MPFEIVYSRSIASKIQHVFISCFFAFSRRLELELIDQFVIRALTIASTLRKNMTNML